MPATPRKLHLNAFLRNIGQHEAAWRLPQTDIAGVTGIDHYINLARIAERGKLDGVFFADHPVLKERTQDRPFDALDPFTLIAALSTATEKIGLVATASTTYDDPYSVGRRFATLDHVSRGRAGWNVVTTAYDSVAANFGFEAHPDPNLRYAKAEEFLDVALKLWDSWEDDAIVGDKQAGVFVDPGRIHAINHTGKYFKVAGPLEIPRSPQGYPVLFQAGSSGPGRDFAAKYAEAIFTAQSNVEDAQEFYRDVKSRARAYGRNPDEVKILPGLTTFVGRTEADAVAVREQLEDLIIPTYGLAQLSTILGFKVHADELDKPLVIPPEFANATHKTSRGDLIQRLIENENLTVRQLLRRFGASRGHWTITGTPEQIANEMEHWFNNEAADGFNLIPPALPSSLEAFVDLVVPELQRRGLFRLDYEGTTLRSHLGLSRPKNRFLKMERRESKA